MSNRPFILAASLFLATGLAVSGVDAANVGASGSVKGGASVTTGTNGMTGTGTTGTNINGTANGSLRTGDRDDLRTGDRDRDDLRRIGDNDRDDRLNGRRMLHRAAFRHHHHHHFFDRDRDDMRPAGWNHGRKTGWHCRVGSASCVPPGQR